MYGQQKPVSHWPESTQLPHCFTNFFFPPQFGSDPPTSGASVPPSQWLQVFAQLVFIQLTYRWVQYPLRFHEMQEEPRKSLHAGSTLGTPVGTAVGSSVWPGPSTGGSVVVVPAHSASVLPLAANTLAL
jgi:hypothetical protein